jgi:hypothetical protein
VSIWDYRVQFVYGYSKAYGSKFHTGEDRPAPRGTPVTVNGVTIGLVGTTGYSTGYHLHVGKWGGGGHYPPNGGGATLSNAKVTEIDTAGKTPNGRFVRVQSGNYSWVYLHLDKVLVKVGQVLKGEEMFNGRTAKQWFSVALGYDKRIKALTKALANEKNKKPEVVIKEVEKIVNKIQKVEVIREVPAEINEQEVVQGFFSRLWNNLFKGSK